MADQELQRHYANRDLSLKKLAEYRAKKRPEIRAAAANESQLLTDSYVRNQLSKYSTKRTWQWTEQEVAAKREIIANSRKKRMTPERCRQLVEMRAAGRPVNEVAEHFKISRANVFLIQRKFA